MSLLNLFKSRKKKTAACALTGTLLQEGEGRLVTTAEVIVSKKFWESIMTEPEAMAYTINFFKKRDPNALLMRKAIFQKYANKQEPWIISEDCLQTYEIHSSLNGTHVKEWWLAGGEYTCEGCGRGADVLAEEEFHAAEDYAIKKAGESRVPS